MIKKIFILSIITAILLTGCSCNSNSENSASPETTPTLSPLITTPEGQFLDTNPPRMEGLVISLDNDTITLKIQDTEYVLTLSERAKEEIEIYKTKFETPVQVGSFLQIPYEEADGGYIAKNILFVESN